jgi:NAD(P)-dependent dehydrogenase (short-subunit alcohol dehydrogenase family)
VELHNPATLTAQLIAARALTQLKSYNCTGRDPSLALIVRSWITAAVDKFGRLDVAIANAGFYTQDTLAEGDPDHWREMILTNVLGPALLIRAALPALRQTRGRIVLVGSVAGVKNTPGNLYSVTKWAVTALAENTRMMVTGDGIGVTLVAPGRLTRHFGVREERGDRPCRPIRSPMPSFGRWCNPRESTSTPSSCGPSASLSELPGATSRAKT